MLPDGFYTSTLRTFLLLSIMITGITTIRSKDIMKNCGVVFDVDDTLYDMSIPFSGAYQALYSGQSHLPMHNVFLSFRRYSDERFDDAQKGKMTMESFYIYRFRMTMREYGIPVTDKQALEFQRLYMNLQYRIQLTDTMKNLLDRLQNNVKIGIITNGDSVHQRRKINSLGISHWIPKEHIIVSGDHVFHKPDARIFHEMEERLVLPAVQLIYVGDAFSLDIVGGNNAGWHTLWFNHRHRNKPNGSIIMPNIEVHSE